MHTKFAFRLAAASAGVVVIALLLSGAAKAVTDTVFKYSTEKTGWLGLAPHAFSPSNTAATNANYGLSSGSMSAISTACFSASVNLPHGAKITSVAVWYRADTDGGVIAALQRMQVSNGTSANIVSLTSHDASGTRVAMSDAPAASFSAVNNQQYVYGLAVCLEGSGNIYYAGRINYTYTTAGD